jgi:hypothetical protein
VGHVARMGEERVVYSVWWGNLRERDHWGDPGVDGRVNIRVDLKEVGCGGMDWTGLGQDRDRLRALVNAVMNLRFSPVTLSLCYFVTQSVTLSLCHITFR